MSKHTDTEEKILARVAALCASKATPPQRSIITVCTELSSDHAGFKRFERAARDLAYQGNLVLGPEEPHWAEILSLPATT